MSAIFFYGLFMDQERLVGMGLHPTVLGPAVLPDHRIHIGERATLLRSPSQRAYGIVMELPAMEASTLYSEPSVRAYVPERVRVTLLDTDEPVDADCYLLPPPVGLAGANPTYAVELSLLAGTLGFDPAYVEEIAAFARSS